MPVDPDPRAPVPRLHTALACAVLGVALLPTAGGCAGLRQAWDKAIASDVAHPAVPEPPPRIAGATVAPELVPGGLDRPSPLTLAGADGGGQVRTAALNDPFSDAPPSAPSAAAADGPPHFDDADVVATVNGEPLLAGDLLQFEADLARLAEIVETAPNTLEDPERGLTPGQRHQLRQQLDAERARRLAERLPVKIEEHLLAQRMRRAMDEEQLESLDAMVGTIFRQTAMQEMIRQANDQAAAAGDPPVRDEADLKKLMAGQGTRLQAVIDAWKPQQMAMAYVEQHTPTASIRVSRGEIADYYETHLDEFTPPRAARWSQIELPYAGPSEKLAAAEVIEVAAAELKRGTPFAEVASQYSKGPKADDGGRWDWTVPDSLADAPADAALWNQPVGEIGAVVDCPRPRQNGGAGGVLKLIRVDERRGDAAKPLSELRGRIEKVIEGEKKHRAIQALLTEERARAQVEVFVPGAVWPPAE